MANTYTWVVKNLNSDQRGYAQSIYFELQGTDNTHTVTTSCISIFGGTDYKPMTQWTQADIDAWAANFQPNMEKELDNQIAILASGESLIKAPAAPTVGA